MTLIIFAGVIGWRWFAHASDPIDRHFRWILGTLLLVAPTLHFWYLTWLLPFVCLRPSLAWLSFSVSAAAYFFVWTQEPWGLSPLQQSLFWGPFFAAASYELWSTRGRVLWPLKIPNSEQPPQIAVVIPSYQAADRLGECLASLEKQSHPAAAVHIMDAGSSDATAQIAQQSKLKPQFNRCHSRGRGHKLRLVSQPPRAPWVLVLHADATLQPHAIDCLQRYLAPTHKPLAAHWVSAYGQPSNCSR